MVVINFFKYMKVEKNPAYPNTTILKQRLEKKRKTIKKRVQFVPKDLKW